MSSTVVPSLSERKFAIDALPYIDEAQVSQDLMNSARREIAIGTFVFTALLFLGVIAF